MTLKIEILIVAICALLAAFMGFGSYRHNQGIKEGSDRVRSEWNAEKAVAAVEAASQAVANQNETDRRIKEQQEIAHAAQLQASEARAAAASAHTASVRLQQRYEAALASIDRATPADPAASSGSSPAQSAADLLANVQRRIDEAAGRIGEFADESRTAGIACVSSYESLTLKGK